MIRIEEAAERLVLHEGMRLKPYRCPAGKLTIGAGRNLEDKSRGKHQGVLFGDAA